VSCENFPWYDYIVTKTHVETECDPKVWSDVSALVRRELPEPPIRPVASSNTASPVNTADAVTTNSSR
jgi:hypothetical protein